MVHTQGPWESIQDQNGLICVRAGNFCTIAHLYVPPVGEQSANANLVAAAPEMLEALKDAVRLIEHLGGNTSCQQKAIAKAMFG